MERREKKNETRRKRQVKRRKRQKKQEKTRQESCMIRRPVSLFSPNAFPFFFCLTHLSFLSNLLEIVQRAGFSLFVSLPACSLRLALHFPIMLLKLLSVDITCQCGLGTYACRAGCGCVEVRHNTAIAPINHSTGVYPPRYRPFSGGLLSIFGLDRTYWTAGSTEPVAPVAYQVILEPGIGQFREFEPRRVYTHINSLVLFLVHKLTSCGKRESVS